MKLNDEMQKIFHQLEVFNKMFDILRFVDPLTKRVISYKDETLSETSNRCFDLWGKNTICNNCYAC